MASKHKNPINTLIKMFKPNWAQLHEKLKTNAGKNHFSKRSSKPDTVAERSVLGKRTERSQASKPNQLIPTSSDCSLTNEVAMDCEMVTSSGNKSALGRVTLVNKWGNVVHDEFVRPVGNVVDFRTEISGFQPQNLRKAKRAERSQASKPNPLIPTSSDCSLTDEVAMDCEMVTLSGNKSALGRVTMVNKWGNIVYDEFVRPVGKVVNFRTEISGIRPQDLRKAKNFNVAQTKVAKMIYGKILVGHALRNDLKALQLSHPKKDIRDTSEYAPYLKKGRSRSLKNLAAEFLNVKIQNGEHCSIDDTRAAMLLYQKSKEQWERRVKNFGRIEEEQKKPKPKKKKNIEVGNGRGVAAIP